MKIKIITTALMILVCLFFVSLSVISTYSYFSTRAEVKENVLSASSWQTPEEAVAEVSETLESSASALYQLTGEDFQTTFSQEDFEAAVAASGIAIEAVKIVTEPRIFGQNGEWAEAVLELKVSDGTSQQFRVIFRKEGGLWRIFGTEEL